MVLKYPIIIITFFVALGIAVGLYINLTPVAAYAVAATALAVLLIARQYFKKSLVQRPYFAIAALILAFSTGLLVHSLHYVPNHSSHYSHLLTKDTPVIKGFISERLKPSSYQEKYYFEVLSLNRQPAKGRILLNVKKDSTQAVLHAGDAFIIADTPSPISKALNPGQFDYAAYMQKQDIFHQLELKDNYVQTSTIKNFTYYVGRLREELTNSFTIHNYAPTVSNTINALLLGQRQDMDEATAGNYKAAGVLHILAISGLHFSVLFYMLTLLLKPLKHAGKTGKLLYILAVLALLWGFALITGLSASVVRSVVMFTFISIGLYLNRNTSIYNSLGVSMLVLLLAKPAFLFDAGFQLSYLAVFAIVALEPVYRRIKTWSNRAVAYISDTLAISLAAQIGVLPLSLYYFSQFPLLFLLANLVVIPLSNIVLIIGVLVLILNFAYPDAAIIIGKLLEGCVWLMNGFIAWIASFDHLVLKDIPFTLWLTVALYAVIAIAIIWLYQKSYRNTVALLCSILFFQVIYAVTAWSSNTELIVFNNRRSSLAAVKSNSRVTVLSTDSLALENNAIRTYNKSNLQQEVVLKPLQNILWFNNRKIVVIDSSAVYSTAIKPHIVILTQSPKINLERLIEQLKPKQIIADGTNYKNLLQQWRVTCKKQKIPFHATAEKGFYKLNGKD